ncbi:DeoR/GlpR family DNA-binding transcription regulator [Flavobacteriaceae bacterium F89]|uniref:DeoR/GlpR family DNA-binding transcription regulator n=1 Tax=Cerina litoralis TaxID=2874477 RepID=A0AAE3EYN8_9FLAO|nr:DeoR/GlpR family DNA-binding transcription regulator [Cerina litoralis]MCG2462142.1 DeoR/GlpR family DNA-binding transcription regulator [Cerina litoralis]
MQKDERQRFILEKLRGDSKVATQRLADQLMVSEDTIRRDLNEMSQKGLLTKVHGGAVSSIQKLYYYNDNVIRDQREKDVIAKKAVSLLSDGMSVVISDGTTNLAFARNIPKDLKATVFTYCLPIAMELTEHPGIEIVFLGGRIEKKSMVALGLDVINKFSEIYVDLCFLGTGSIGHIEGITEGSYDVSLIKRKIVAASDKVVSLATSNKLGLRQSYSICKPSDISILVTELDPNRSELLPFSDAGIRLL